jgi:hypothetical protein
MLAAAKKALYTELDSSEKIILLWSIYAGENHVTGPGRPLFRFGGLCVSRL